MGSHKSCLPIFIPIFICSKRNFWAESGIFDRCAQGARTHPDKPADQAKCPPQRLVQLTAIRIATREKDLVSTVGK